jgi:hypothetical protein
MSFAKDDRTCPRQTLLAALRPSGCAASALLLGDRAAAGHPGNVRAHDVSEVSLNLVQEQVQTELLASRRHGEGLKALHTVSGAYRLVNVEAAAIARVTHVARLNQHSCAVLWALLNPFDSAGCCVMWVRQRTDKRSPVLVPCR